jgi:hypothetical protein
MNGTGPYPRGGAGKRNYEAPEWRFADLIDSLKPYSLMIERLVDKGYPRIPQSSIAGWRARNSIPTPWVPAFIELGIESRVIGKISDMLVKS